ncbi:MAG TPA: hypothetical protein VJQ61_06115 [Sinomonas sp.]|nr:hypothetical protein [Sinomonas sp.]
MTAIHRFRDGNTRSQSAYVSMLAERAGHPIDWRLIDVDLLRELRLHAMAGHEKALADYLHDRLLPPPGPVEEPGLSQVHDSARLSFPGPASEAVGRPPEPGTGEPPGSTGRVQQSRGQERGGIQR